MNRDEMYLSLGVSDKVLQFGEAVLDELKPRFAGIEEIAELNQAKVIGAMQKNRVNATHFAASTGYGYDDEGRDNLERVYASAFHTEAALVRPQITCGTHALAIALFGNLRPGDELLSPVGKPYDTLEEVIGIRPSNGSLAEYGVKYRQVDLLEDGTFDYENIKKAVNEKTKLVTIQRSKGYQTRPSFSVKQIGELIAFVKKIKPDVVFSKGGFVSVPVVLAAKHCHIPAIIHESDITPGLANRIAIRGAKKVCCNFPETLQYLPKDKAVLTGSPIRQELRVSGGEERLWTQWKCAEMRLQNW